jgi:hypothetical protein
MSVGGRVPRRGPPPKEDYTSLLSEAKTEVYYAFFQAEEDLKEYSLSTHFQFTSKNINGLLPELGFMEYASFCGGIGLEQLYFGLIVYLWRHFYPLSAVADPYDTALLRSTDAQAWLVKSVYRIWNIHCEERASKKVVHALESVCETIDALYDVVRRDPLANTGTTMNFTTQELLATAGNAATDINKNVSI